MKGLGVGGANDPLKASSEVQEVCVGVVVGGGGVGENAGTDGDGLHELEDGYVGDGHVAPDGEAYLPSVAVHGPNGNVEEGAGGGDGLERVPVTAVVALQGDPEQTLLHLSGQVGGWNCEFEKQERETPGVVLEAEAHSPLSVTEEGAGDDCSRRLRVARQRVVRRRWLEPTARNHALHQRPERPSEPHFAPTLHGRCGVHYMQRPSLPSQVYHPHLN